MPPVVSRLVSLFPQGLVLPSMLALVLAPVLLAAVFLEVREQFAQARELAAAVNRSYEERLQLKKVFSLVQDTEIGQRGYIITGQRAFLEPYEASQTQLAAELQTLRTLVSRPPADGEPVAVEKLESLARIERLISAKLAFSQESVALREAGGDAVSAVASGEGKRIMDAFRAEVRILEASEAEGLDARVRAAESRARTIESFITVALATLAALLLAAVILVLRQWRQRQDLLQRERRSAARNLAIFESATDALITFNRSGTIESVNRAGEQMFGFSRAEIARRDVGLLLDLPATNELFINRLAGPGGISPGLSREYVGRRKDGGTFPAEVSLGRFELDGEVFIVSSIRDISERRRVEKLKSEFVSTVSHELRTPLTSIAGSLGLLVGGAAGTLPERAGRLLAIAHANCQRLVRLINDILDIEKLESGQMAFRWGPVDLADAARRAAEGMTGLASETGVALRIETTSVLPKVVGDTDRLAQVVWNLVSNALKFSPKGAEVEVSVETGGEGWPRLTVRDHGPGIQPEFRERIFSRFAQADSSDTRAKGGTGLGLAISRQIVERHGGRLWFESEPGKGATFIAEFPPGATQAAPSGPAAAAAQPTPLAQPGGGRPVVLHVDDDADVRELVARALQPYCDVESVCGLREARERLGGLWPDLVVLDVGLPDGSGFALRPILAQQGRRTPPVVVFSAQSVAPDEAAQVAAVLTKSRESLDQLVSTVTTILESGELRKMHA
ncbi:ATP-binding protein [Phenylobacterium sp.]|uniref:ATP-binding protein n=1 Tax=Phenylobacterium sp. TaxID=1871053 RepID=UPI002E31A062|nr:ATP-binding protein [Phenylobacterium sp.]HEX2559466.1 ATP-binding protein [Phenylobacterium sp.]